MNKKTQLILVSIPLLLTLMGAAYTGAQLNIPDVTNHRTIEGVITEIRPNEYYSFKVSYYIDGKLDETWCTPSTFFATLYKDGMVIAGDTRALALVDPDSTMGIVFDSIPNEPEPEPVADPEPEVTPDEEPVETPETEPEVEPEPEPEPEVCLPAGLIQVSAEAQPRPDLVAPEGMVKLTIMAQPSDLEGVTVCPPPGIYYADEGLKLLFTCTVDNPHWSFAYWNIGMGADGSIRKSGVGYEHYIRVTIDRDMVVTAFLNELI